MCFCCVFVDVLENERKDEKKREAREKAPWL